MFVTNLRDTPVVGQVTDENGGLALRSVFFDARTIGGEIEAVYAPIRGLRFGASLSLQDASYTNYSPLTVFDFETNENLVLDFSDNKVERIPALSFDLTGSYNFSNFNVYISWRYVGERWGNRRNTYKLGDFSEFGLGASYTANQRLKFAVQVINLFDSEGLIQGNSRTQDSISETWASDPTRINIGEFIFPRSANFSVHYSF